MDDVKEAKPRSEPRRLVAQLMIITATSLALGHCLRQPTQMGANDISRWCTVWSLLERGTYVIDECPWQIETQDKVLHEAPTAAGAPPSKHFYSSKPALLPTLIAGILYPARRCDRRSAAIESFCRSARSGGLKSQTRRRQTGSRAFSRLPKNPRNGRPTSSISNRSSCS